MYFSLYRTAIFPQSFFHIHSSAVKKLYDTVIVTVLRVAVVVPVLVNLLAAAVTHGGAEVLYKES